MEASPCRRRPAYQTFREQNGPCLRSAFAAMAVTTANPIIPPINRACETLTVRDSGIARRDRYVHGREAVAGGGRGNCATKTRRSR